MRLSAYPHIVVATAVAAGLACGPEPSIALVAAPVAGGGLVAARVTRALALLAAVGLLIGCSVGATRTAAIDGSARQIEPGERVDGRAIVAERPRPSRFGSSAVLEIERNGTRVLARAPARLRWPAHGA